MKKLYVILLSICLMKPVIGQPVFTQSDFIQIGATITTTPLDTTGLSEGGSGANQTWNFSAVPASGVSVTAIAVAPASTPYASMFPTANLAVKTISSAGNDAYGFYNVTANWADLIGAGTHSSTTDIFFNYTNTLRAVNFPYTYNSSLQDSYVAFATYSANGFQLNDYKRGTISIVADAYGSITTPDATYPSALRSVQSESVVDSITVVGFPTAATLVTSNHTSYSWTPDHLFNSVFIFTYDTTSQGFGPQPSKSASYSSGITGINENYTPKALDIYPNPAVKLTRVNINSDDLDAGTTTFRAIDLNGRVVKQFDFMMYAANHKSVSIDMSDFNSGLYFIQLVQKGKIYSTKFLLN